MSESSKSDVFEEDCPGREILDHVTSRWGFLILLALRKGPLRFFELRDQIGGVSEKMLSQTLRMLEGDGFLLRTVEPSIPPKVTYRLTRLGRSLSLTLGKLLDWVDTHTNDVLAARRARR